MKIYFAGDVGGGNVGDKRERMLLNLADHRLLRYYHPNREKLLRLWINHLIEYKVECDGIRIYQGSRMSEAIDAWEGVI